jgi:hypothetical protein
MEKANVIKWFIIYSIFFVQCHAEDNIYNCHMNFFSCFIKYFAPQQSCTVFVGPLNISTIDKLSDSLVYVTAIDEPINNSTIFYNSECVFIQTSSDLNSKLFLRNIWVFNSNVHILMKQGIAIDDNWPLTINSQVYEYTENYEIYEVYRTEKSAPSIRRYITKWTPNEGFKLNECSIYERRKQLQGIQLTATVIEEQKQW